MEVQEAGRQPSQAAVAEPGVVLLLEHVPELDTHFTQSFTHLVYDTQIDECVFQQAP